MEFKRLRRKSPLEKIRRWWRSVTDSFRNGPIGVVSRDPLILTCWHLGGRRFPLLHLALISRHFRNRELDFLVIPSWALTPSSIRRLRWQHWVFRRCLPKHTIHFLANTPADEQLLREAGLNTFYCSQNCLVDERIFKPLGKPKKYRAIYDARVDPFKRHWLASDIDNLALLFYFPKTPDLSDKYFLKIRELLRDAHCVNMEGEEYRRLDAAEVNEAISHSEVGLCLSAEEGAMYASVQYLLAGVPVVTTRNIGGRDELFDPELVIWADDSPAAVAAATTELIERQLAAEHVRGQTMKRIEKHRQVLIDHIQTILDRNGAGRNFADEWPAVFFDKMVHWERTRRQVVDDLRQNPAPSSHDVRSDKDK